MSLSLGARLGSYEITAAIGAGGMGEVYRGRDATLNRDVAIKVLPAGLASDAERLARFKREAQVLASLNHPNIAHVYGFEAATLTDGSTAHFLAMEMVEGEDLAERLKRGAIPVDESIAIAKQIAEGLEEAHEHGIIHRDLKPANVKLDPDGKVKILDFGLAKALEGDPTASAASSQLSHSPTISRHMTEAGMIMGTAAYMSPEQARGKKLDRRTDIWAFGVVLYEMLTGQRLFAGETVSDVLAAVLTREPDWSALPTSTPVAVRRLLTRALDRDPKKRLRDIGEATIVLADPAQNADAAGTVSPTRMATRERLAWAAAGLALFMAAGMALRLVRGHGDAGASGPLHFSLAVEPSEILPTHAAMAPDGMSVAFVGRLPGAAVNTIFLRSLRGTTANPLPGTEGVGRAPAFSPDGKWLAFVAHNRSLKKIPIGGGSPIELTRGNFRFAYMAWTDTGRIVLTQFNPDQPGVLYDLPASGGNPTALPSQPDDATAAVSFPRALPGGRSVLLTTAQAQPDLVLQSLETGERKVLTRNARYARLFGKSVIWLSDDKLMAAGLNERQLALVTEPVALPVEGLAGPGRMAFDISNTGSLVFRRADDRSTPAVAEDADTGTGGLIWIDRNGKRTPGPNSTTVGMSEPRLAPDEAYALIDGAGRIAANEVWTVALRRGSLSRLSFGDGEDETGVWSPDGASIVWASSRTGEGRALYRRRSDGSGREERLWDCGGFHCHAGAWTPDGRSILVTVDNPKSGFDILLVTLGSPPAAKPLLTDPFNETTPRLSPNGRWMVYSSDESGRQEIYVQSFPDLGRKIQISVDGGQEPVWRPDGTEIVYRSTSSRDFMSVGVRIGEALAPSEPRILVSDAGLRRGETDHTQYAVTRDGRILAVAYPRIDEHGDLTFILGWAQSVGLNR